MISISEEAAKKLLQIKESRKDESIDFICRDKLGRPVHRHKLFKNKIRK